MLALRRMTVALSLSLCLSGCNAAFWGNLGVLGITVGIFLGTVFLGRAAEAREGTGSSASTTTRS